MTERRFVLVDFRYTNDAWDIFAFMRRAAHTPCVGVSPMPPQRANSLPWSSRSIGYRRVFSDRQRC
jgi:hypothetical protein